MKNEYLGAEIKKLGFGLMRPPFISEDGDLAQMCSMVDAFIEKGFTYFDTSYFYGQGLSESYAKKAIVDRYPRDAFQLATKLPLWTVDSPKDMANCLNKSLERTGLNYIDFYMLHGLSKSKSDRFPGSYLEKAEKFGAWDFLRQAKSEGKVKHIGFSFHDTADVLDELLTKYPDMEFVQLQINYADWNDENIQSGKCYEVAMKHKKPVIIMEPLKGGTLLKLRPEVEALFKSADAGASTASWAIRFSASLNNIITVLSGMQSLEIVQENAAYMADFKPLTEEERAVIDKAVTALQAVNTIQCTGCRYCTADCPRHIQIPSIFEYVNDYRIYNDLTYSKRRYLNKTAEGGKASDCIQCGLCESHCPQKLGIINFLEDAVKLLES